MGNLILEGGGDPALALPLLRVYGEGEVEADDYPVAWRHQTFNAEGIRLPPIKDLVRELAGHRCVRCGHPYVSRMHGNGEWSPCDDDCVHEGPTEWRGSPRQLGALWRVLTVHHLNGVKWDCRWWNLAALCQRCHLSVQGRVRLEQVYVEPHTAWFKPYAAGYYADAYLGEQLSREQVMARLDELLALELDPAYFPKPKMVEIGQDE